MTSCPGCGADVLVVLTPDGSSVSLDKWTDTTGDRRFRLTDFGPPLRAEPVTANSPIDAYPDHRKDCPYHGNGLD